MEMKISNLINMDKSGLEKLSKSELINLLLKQQKKPSPKPRRPVPTPRTYKSVKDMVQKYEDNIIIPPLEFRDDYKPIPAPRTKKQLQAPIPAPRTKKQTSEKPVPEKRTIISLVEKALEGYTK